MISYRAIIGVLMDAPLGSDELEKLRTIELLINMPVTVGQLKVTVRIFCKKRKDCRQYIISNVPAGREIRYQQSGSSIKQSQTQNEYKCPV